MAGPYAWWSPAQLTASRPSSGLAAEPLSPLPHRGIVSHRRRYTLGAMRRFLSLRWLGLHAAMVVFFAGFLGLGWWQLHRAEGGNPLSWGYTFEWPLFAGFVVVFWVKMMRDELREARELEAAGDGADAGGADGEPGAATEPEQLPLPAGARARHPQPTDQADDEDDEELAAYNAYLAQLNAEPGKGHGWLSGRGARRPAAALPGRPEPPSGSVEV